MKRQQNSSLLQVRNLKVQFDSPAGMVRAVDDVSFDLGCGEKACLVGESGCGKTILALSLLRLLPPGAKISGQVLFRGDDLLALSERKMRRVRRRGMGMIFEQPSAYLNPLFPVVGRSPRRSGSAGDAAGTRPISEPCGFWTWPGSRKRRNGSVSSRTSFPEACANG